MLSMSLVATCGRAAVLFSDDFEAGLGQWTGKKDGTNSALVLADPLATGRGNVLAFAAVTNGGDVFSRQMFANDRDIRISFDYLGLARTGSTAGNLGGFFGIAPTSSGEAPNTWIAATQNNYPGLSVALLDDGRWHRYTHVIDAGSSYTAFHLMVEDYRHPLGGAVPGDAYFDDFVVEALPALHATIQSGNITLQIDGRTNATYALQSAPELPTTNWTTLTNIVLTSTPHSWLGPAATHPGQQFFRAIRLP